MKEDRKEEGSRGKEGESKRQSELMSHLRQWRGFQVRSIGSAFHTGASLGEFLRFERVCVGVCVCLSVCD